MRIATRIFPFLNWFRAYSLDGMRIDAVSGLTVALVLIPQSMAYAQLAGLPPYYGLYASFLPPMIGALFGSSLQLATGPVAVVSLMTSASLAPLATAGSQGYIAYAVLLALMVGVVQFVLGVLRLGLVVNFLSHPVVNGFTNAAAIIIASSQLSKLFGVHVDNARHHYETIIHVIREAVHYTHWPTLFMGVLAFAVMYGLKRLWPKIPNVLAAVSVTVILSWAMGFEHNSAVDISAFHAPGLRDEITAFNETLRKIPPLGEKQARMGRTLEEARRSHDEVWILDAAHDAGVIAVEMERLTHRLQEHRERLRRMLFAGVVLPDGSLHFYPASEVPEGEALDGRVWRLRVGNLLLEPERIPMTGGGEVVGAIPRGLPSFTMPGIDFGAVMHLVPFAAIISLLGFMEAISIAKAMAARTGQRLDPNQELIGQGLANICGAIGKSYPTSGSFSRSAVNLQSGAVSGLSSVFTGLTVLLVLLFFTPLLYHLPQSVLAAVIMMAVIGLVNVHGFVHAWKAQWYDGAISVITFLCTLGFAPHLDRGIMVGVGLSLSVFLYKSMRPTVASFSWHEDESLRDSVLHNLAECRYIDIISFEGALFFANASYLEDQINTRMAVKKDLRHIIIAANGINDMDASGEEILSLVVARVRSAGVDISLSSVNEAVMAVLIRTHLIEVIGRNHIYPSMERAISAVYGHAHMGGEEPHCPLESVRRLVNEIGRREESRCL